VSTERLGNALPVSERGTRANGGTGAIGGVVAPTEVVAGKPVDPDAEAEAFVRFCYRRRAVAWPELYDEMCAVAAREEYQGLGYEQLARLGIGFALSSLPRLAEVANRVIAEERTPQRIVAVA